MSEQKSEEEEKSPSSSDSDDSPTPPPSLKSSSKNIQNSPSKRKSSSDSGIIEVFNDNFLEEMKNLISLLNEYNYIGMDTEYPGIVYNLQSYTEDFYYKLMKMNVEELKLIQLGITLSNKYGEHPHPYHTWQFNFKFDPIKDKSSPSSMKLLINSGINFSLLKNNGIEHKEFFEEFKTSGLVLNPKINWISFHGSYDFAYLLNNLLNTALPGNEQEFTKILGLYFPNHYDLKLLIRGKKQMRGSLNNLARYLDVEREGKIHQAGSDSYVTINAFWKLINYKYISKEELLENKNILFGIYKGKDDEETINYTKLKEIRRFNEYNNNQINNNIISNINKNMSSQKYYENNININNPFYMQLNGNVFNYGLNYFYPQMMRNQMNNGLNGMQIMNIIQYA